MASGTSGSNLTSNSTELFILVNDNDTKSYVVTSSDTPILFIDSNVKVGINTVKPGSQCEVLASTGTGAIRLSRDATNRVDLDVDVSGDLRITPNGSGSTFQNDANVTSSAKLFLGGVALDSTATQLSATASTPGTGAAGKNIVADGSLDIANIADVSAASVSGVVQTAEQPSIVKVGDLDSLSVTDAVSCSTISGVVTTADQSAISSVGILDNLNVSGAFVSTSIGGTVTTAIQSNIISLGDLSSISVAGTTVEKELAALSGVVPGTVAGNGAFTTDADLSVSGVSGIAARSISGTLQTGTQPSITRLGALDSLDVSGNLSAALIAGTIETASHPSITSLGRMASVQINGNTLSKELRHLAGVVPGTTLPGKAVALNTTKDIVGITHIQANDIAGIVQTSAQPQIRELGTLTSLSIGGSAIGIEAGYLSSVVPGVAQASKVMVIDGSKSIEGVAAISAISMSGILKTPIQTNITSMGTQTRLLLSGDFTSTAITESVSASSGAIKTTGGVAVGKKLQVGVGINGVISDPKQYYITQVGTLTSLTIAGDLHLRGGSITINGTPVEPTPVGSESTVTTPTYVLGATIGTGLSNKVLTIDDNGDVGSINSLSALRLEGTLQTVSHPAISQLGTLSSLDVTGNASCTKLSGVVDTAEQTNISSLGKLDSLTVSGAVSSTATTNAASSLDGGDFTVSGGMAVSLDAQIGGAVTVAKTLTVGDTGITGLEEKEADPSDVYVIGAAEGTALPNKMLVTDENVEIADINSLSTDNLSVVGTVKYELADKWTIRSISAISPKFTSVCTSDNLIVAVGSHYGNYGKVVTSTDGITWTPTTSADDTCQWMGVCWSSKLNRFVAVASSGTTTRSMYSDNGITWAAGDIYTGSMWTSVTYCPTSNGFVAVAKTGTYMVAYSLDGITWTSVAKATFMGNYSYSSIANSGLYTVTVADGGLDASRVMRSTSLTNYYAVATPTSGYSWTSVCYSPKLTRFVAVSSTKAAAQVMYSTNNAGTSWLSATVPLNQFDAYTSWYSVTWSEEAELFVAVGESLMMKSTDGITWTYVDFDSSVNRIWDSVAWFNAVGRFVAVNGQNRDAMTSEVVNSSEMNLVSYTGITNQTSSLKLGIKPSSALEFYGPSRLINESGEVMRVSESGRIGVGVTAPSHALDIDSTDKTEMLGLKHKTLNNKTTFTAVDETTISIDKRITFNNTGSGAMTVQGGLGIALDLYAYTSGLTHSANTSTVGTDVTVAGGASVAGSIFTNGNALTSTGVVTLTDNTESTSTGTGSLVLGGGLGIASSRNMYIGGAVTIGDVTESTSATTGALVVSGGVGVGGDLFAPAEFSLLGSDDSTSVTTGAVTTVGGLGVDKSLNVAGSMAVADTTASTSTTTGAFAVAGGFGVGGNLNASGKMSIASSTLSTGVDSGAMIVGGNAAISSDVTVASNVGALDITSTGMVGFLNAKLNDPAAPTDYFDIQSPSTTLNKYAPSGFNYGGYLEENPLYLLTTDITTGNTLVVPQTITDVTESTDSTTGALTVAGGAGVGLSMFVGGNGNFGGVMTQASDRRLKTDIQSLDMERVYKLYESDVVTFKWKHDTAGETQEVGVIAQDLVASELTDLVREINNPSMEAGEDPVLSPEGKQWCVNYAGIAVYNMRMIQELLAEDEEFKQRLSALEAR